MSGSGRLQVAPPGFAEPAYPPDEWRGTDLHRRMMRVYDPAFGGFWRRYRARYFDRFRLFKLRTIFMRMRFPFRLLNFLLYLVEKDRVANVHYAPVMLHLDPTNACNLRCPGCTTGDRTAGRRPDGRADLELMIRRIDEFYRWGIQLQLVHWGEPLLNPAFFPACAHATSRGLWTVTHTNLSFKIEGLAQRLVDTGLCNLVVSCDGATQETYEKYRVGGRVELVFDNLSAIAREKRRIGSRRPWITAKFVVFDHNWHEMEQFRERALEAGADEAIFIGGLTDGIYRTGRASSERQFDLPTLSWARRRMEPGCFEIWQGMSVNSDGSAYPCCDGFREDHEFVTAEEAGRTDWRPQWNNEKYLQIREYFIKRELRGRAQLPHPCHTCERTGREHLES